MKLSVFAPISGIYRITCFVTRRVYVGESVNIAYRLHTHVWKLIHNDHPVVQLQADFNQYGIDAFTAAIVVLCPDKQRLDYEHTCKMALLMEGIELYNSTGDLVRMGEKEYWENLRPQLEKAIDLFSLISQEPR